MAQNPLGPPPFVKQEAAFDRWMRLMYQRISSAGQVLWSYLDFTGSDLTDIATRNHADLQNINTASYTHLSAANHTDLTDGGDSTLHYHSSDRYTHPNHSGDVTSVGDGAQTIAADAVTNTKLANMATQTIKGRTNAGTGDPEDLTAAQATAILDAMVGDSGLGGTKGLVPAPTAGDASKYLKGDGTWAAVSAGGGSNAFAARH